MIRQVSAIVIVLCVSAPTVYAQTAQVVVNAASTEVRTGPSNVNPVIGHATRGTVLQISRDVGDWYKVSWPEAADGVGYVRKSLLSQGASSNQTRVAATNGRRPTATSTRTAQASGVRPTGVADQGAERQPSPSRTSYVAAPSHVFGLGGRLGAPMGASTMGFGGSARAWTHHRFGVQFDVSRYALTSVTGADRITSLQFAPSLLVTLPGRLTDDVWMRPYVGAGGRFHRSTLTSVVPGVTMSDNAFGMHAFGGGELTFAAMPQFALSADVGYDWSRTLATGFDPRGVGFSVAGHWYVR